MARLHTIVAVALTLVDSSGASNFTPTSRPNAFSRATNTRARSEVCEQHLERARLERRM